MSASVRFVGYRDKKGFVVRGGPKVEPSRTDRHMARSFYLVSQLEAANWGTVQNYDGAGMSAGPLHVIAVFPATGDQGPLWRMVRRIFDTSSTASTDALKRRLAPTPDSTKARSIGSRATSTPKPTPTASTSAG